MHLFKREQQIYFLRQQKGGDNESLFSHQEYTAPLTLLVLIGVCIFYLFVLGQTTDNNCCSVIIIYLEIWFRGVGLSFFK